MNSHVIRLAFPWTWQIAGPLTDANGNQSGEGELTGEGKLKSESDLAALLTTATELQGEFVLKLSRNFNQPTNIENCLVNILVAEHEEIEPLVTMDDAQFPLFEFSNQAGQAFIDVTQFLKPHNQLDVVFQKADCGMDGFADYLKELCGQTNLVIVSH